MNQPILFMVFINGIETKSVYSSLAEAQNAAIDHISAEEDVCIKTFNSMAPVQTWKYDYSINNWVEQR